MGTIRIKEEIHYKMGSRHPIILNIKRNWDSINYYSTNIENLSAKFVPVIIYNNAETDKLRILTDSKQKAGIYMWKHNESGKVYIGSAVDLSRRLTQYFSMKYLEKNKTMHICNALVYHGFGAFSLSISEYIDISNLSKKEANKLILEREQFYLDNLKPGYNINLIAGSRLGTLHSEDSIARMSEIQKNIDRTAMNNPMYGRIGDDHPRFGKSHSIDSRTKISEAKGMTIYVYNSEGSLVNSFSSANIASKEFNCSHTTIIRNAKNNKLFQNKWYLSFSDDLLINTSKSSSDNDK
jgi:group I intron endonuclease